MAERARYDDKFRASAIVMLQAAGWPNQEGALTRTAQHLRIPLTTLRRWASGQQNPPPADLVSEKKAELSDLLDKEIEAALNEMNSARSEASYRDLGTVIGILIDKKQLISGQPTENNRQRIIIEYQDVEIDATPPPLSAANGREPSEAL